MIRVFRFLPVILTLPFAQGQAAVDVNVGLGTARSSATGQGIDTLGSATNSLGSCTPGSTDVNCLATSKLGGVFLGIGGDVMLFQHFGVGAEINVQPTHHDYGPLRSRQTFIDLNGIFQPIATKRASLQLQGGIGSAKTSFVITQTGCVGTAVCNTSTSAVGSASHFQVHVGAGVQIALTNHLFLRPQFDLHYVPNLTDQYGRNTVPEATIWFGYHFGE